MEDTQDRAATLEPQRREDLAPITAAHQHWIECGKVFDARLATVRP